MLSVRFWGVRGSIPCPGPDTVIYGGNTSCLEIRADERLLIIDLGSGLRPLGDWLLENDLKKYGKIKAEMFLTHTHWDHIMGFPVFNPIYTSGTELRITAPVSIQTDSIKSIIENQLSHQYWPVRAEELAAKIEYNQLHETSLDLGDGLTITSKFLNHTILCFGYKVSYQGKSIATVYDHEPFRNLFPDSEAAKEGEAAAAEENEKIRQFIKDTDIVIHDAQYSKEEYSTHIGWGHCSYDYTVQSAFGLGIKKLVLFHHDPAHTDNMMEKLEKSFADYKDPQIIVAKEGLVLEA